MQITEPTTLLTDYLLAAVGIFFAARLGRALKGSLARSAGSDSAADPRSVTIWWRRALLGMSAGALLGGTFHGFTLLLPQWALTALWKGTMLSIGAASAALLLASVAAFGMRPSARGWVWLAGVKWVLFAAWVLFVDDRFLVAILDYGSVMIASVAIHGVAVLSSRRWARWILAGLATSLLASVVQQFGPSLHRHFNHNDLYHLIQMVALWLLYRGALAAVDSDG